MATRLAPGAASALLAAAALGAARGASADEGVAVGMSLQAVGGQLDLTGAGASTADEPTLLQGHHTSLSGKARLAGFGVKAFVSLGPFRFGFGDGLHKAGDGLEVRHDPLDAGFTTHTSSVWGGYGELFAGYQVRLGPFYPYADLRAAIDILNSSVQLLSPQLGLVGTSAYSTVRGDVGLRLGAIVPMGEAFYLDFSGQGGLLGPERMTLTAGVGYWLRSTPLSKEY